jgi:hypothetical protein
MLNAGVGGYLLNAEDKKPKLVAVADATAVRVTEEPPKAV